MARVELRLLGGFELRVKGVPAAGFESRRTRALLAYLALAPRGAPADRRHLSALLWQDETEETARQNLRQALYNLRQILDRGAEPGETPILTASRQTVSVHLGASLWADVEAFEKAAQRGLSGGACVDPPALAEAARLYRGDLLAGFTLEAGVGLEEWLLARQERLRDTMLSLLRALIAHHQGRGEYPAALEFAQRQVELDQLSEVAHRDLMQLYSLIGDRSRALAQYEQCRLLLQLELGVEPLRETRALHDTILAAEAEASGTSLEGGPTGPVLPLVGRKAAYVRLRSIWRQVLTGEPRLTLVVGPEGIGKSRLVKSFIHDATASTDAVVLLAHATSGPLPCCYQAIEEMLRSAISCDPKAANELREGIRSGELAALTPLLPEIETPDTAPPTEPLRADVLCAAVGAALRRIASIPRSHSPAGMIVFIDDLQWADPPTLAMLPPLVAELAGVPVWFVSAYRPKELPAHLVFQENLSRERAAGRVDALVLEPLSEENMTRLARSLVDERARADVLAASLLARTAGLPLAVAEWINLLRDENLLQPHGAGRWALNARFETWVRSAPSSLDEVITRRIRDLPASTRRLLALGAVIGDVFDAELLRETADEAQLVLDHGLEVLLERWLARHASSRWFESRRQRDLVLWNQGARHGTFAFAHKIIRRAVLQTISPDRRQVMHKQVGDALERHAGSGGWPGTEELAKHLLLAREWWRAARSLVACAERALLLGEPGVARAYLGRADECLGRAEQRQGRERASRENGESLRARIATALAAADRQAPPAHEP
jgi:DNA-binding SARP family transcriptional activator